MFGSGQVKKLRPRTYAPLSGQMQVRHSEASPQSGQMRVSATQRAHVIFVDTNDN